jgi:hypothetical protein
VGAWASGVEGAQVWCGFDQRPDHHGRGSQNPTRQDRAVNYRTPYLALTEDYAPISRTLDPTTARMVVVIGGLTGYGTIAAGEFLTDLTPRSHGQRGAEGLGAEEHSTGLSDESHSRHLRAAPHT